MRKSILIAAGVVLLGGTVGFANNGVVVSPYYNNKASTAGESWARGMSDVIRSTGDANLRNSEAAINAEEARSRYIDNRLKGTQAYFENRKMNREYRAAEAGPKITEQQAERIARERAPARATANDVDPITGGLAWPRVLSDAQYAPYRKQLDGLFTERAQQGGAIGMTNYRNIESTSNDLLATLRGNMSSYSPMDYMEAKRFVERLANEARFPTT